MADRRVVEVSGFPTQPYDDDFIKDQLLLYFLRSRNGGGCDVSVRYPTEEEGAAILVFEDEKVVKRILSRKHTLLIGDCTHPLEVRGPQIRSSQFSLTVKTSVDLSYFSNVSEVKSLLERHRLGYHESSSKLVIYGDFCDLRRCRLDLYKILYRENPMKKHSSSQAPTASKHLLSEEMERRTPQNVTTIPERNLPSSSSNLSRKRPEGRGHLEQDIKGDHKYNRSNPVQHSSPRTGPRESPTRVARLPTPTRVQKVSTPKTLSHSFLIDSAVGIYVRTFKQQMIDTLLRQYSIDMSGTNNEDFTCITLTSLSAMQPEHFEDICAKIKNLFDYFNSGLRVENIKLPVNSRFSNEEVTRKIQRYLLDLEICPLLAANNSLDIIGSPDRIMIFLQDWKGTQGKLAQSIFEGSNSPSPPKVGMVSKNLATNDSNSTQPGVSDGRLRGRAAGHDVHIRGRKKAQDGAGSGRAKSSTNHTKESWK